VRQLDAEFRRFFARRMVRGTFLIAVFIIVLVVTLGTAKGHPGSQLSLDPATGRVTDLETGRVVADKSGEFPSQFGGSDEHGRIVFGESDTRTNIGKDLTNVLEGTGVALLFVSFVLGASFVGAEFNVGSLTTQLLFEPRRWRVHLAKSVAVAAGAAMLAFAVLLLVALAMYTLAMYIGTELSHVVQGLDGAFLAHRTAQALRVAAVVGIGAMFAYSVTLIAKRSSAGIIAFILQFVLFNLINPTKGPFAPISHYAPIRGLIAVLVKHTTEAASVQERAIHTTAGGVALTAVWVVVIVGGSGARFARTEVR
jgi:hypothetical protein